MCKDRQNFCAFLLILIVAIDHEYDYQKCATEKNVEHVRFVKGEVFQSLQSTKRKYLFEI
jgi:hypothetical protein